MKPSRGAARVVLIAITVVVIALFYFPLGHVDFRGRWGDGTTGVALQRGGGVLVSAVTPAGPGARAGVRIGDSLVSPPFALLAGELQSPRAGERRSFSFKRPDGSQYTVSLTAVPVAGFTWLNRLSGILAILPATIFLAIAFALVFLRPSVMTWSFFAFAIGYFSTAPAYEFYQALLPAPAYAALTFVISTLLGNFAVMPLLPFVLRFPNNKTEGWTRKVDRVAWIVIAVSFAAYCVDWYQTWSYGTVFALAGFLDVTLPLLVFVAAALILIKRFKTAPASIRQQIGYFVVGLLVSFIAYAVYFIPGVSIGTAQIVGYAVVLMPICVAYAVLRHRVLDINFVLNRAIAYGLVSVVVIAFVSLLDWLLSRAVSEERLATGIELLVTIGIGFLLDRINRVIERVVETVLFRSRRVAESYVRRAAAALPYATEEAAISEGLAQVPVEALRLTAAAVYRQSLDGARFEGIATSSEAAMAPSGFVRNSLLVRMLQSGEDVIWLDELRAHLDADNAAIYVLAVPVTVRHDLVSFTLYGAHKNGAQLDPEEVELLKELAREASRAYDHVEAVRTRERFAHLITSSPEPA